MNKILMLLLSLILSQALAQGQNFYQPSIDDAFDQYREAYLTTDRSKLISLTYPKIVEMSGGAIYMMEEFTHDYNMYAAQGLKIVDLKAQATSKVLEINDELHAMLSYQRLIEAGDEILTDNGLFLIISQDKGVSWSFTDMRKYDLESIKTFIPNYNERFDIYLNALKH